MSFSTEAAEMLKNIEALAAKYVTSNCSMRKDSGGAQYETDEVTSRSTICQ